MGFDSWASDFVRIEAFAEGCASPAGTVAPRPATRAVWALLRQRGLVLETVLYTL